jgi:lysophospholipase
MAARQGSRHSFSMALLLAGAALGALAGPSPARAAPESELESMYAREILPAWRAAESGRLRRPGAVELDWRHWPHPSPRGAIVLLTGRNETHRKHAETAYDLLAEGYAVFIYDHRGQGYSTRLAPDPRVGHVHRFDDYADDLAAFLREVVDPRLAPEVPRYLIAHSLGGAVGARALQRDRGALGLRAVAFVTPMFGIRLLGLTGAAHALTELLTRLGLGDRMVPGGRPYRPLTHNLLKARRSHSELRLRLTEAAYLESPTLAVGAPSNRWVSEAIEGARRVRRAAAQLRLPALVLEATHDRSVTRRPQRQVCEQSTACERIVLEGAFHELLHESDEYRQPAIEEILRFLARHP